jgi:predicted acyl esterase
LRVRFQIRGGARRSRRALLFTAAAVAAVAATLGHHAAAQAPAFTYQHVMVPVRDGVRLETVIMAPADAVGPIPILFRRTPYGVPASAAIMSSPALKDFVRDGYIFVVQNLRGRVLSEGTFELSAKANLKDPKATSETTDAYDSIDWLVKNVPNDNGRGGHLRHVVRRDDGRDDAAAAAPRAQGDLRAGLSRRPVDERRRPPLRRCSRRI